MHYRQSKMHGMGLVMKKTKIKGMKLYMLTLSGQGDTCIKFVEQDVWEWMGAVQADLFAQPNEAVLKKLRRYHDEPDFVPNITSGSAYNDAALQAPPALYQGSKEAYFFDMKSAVDFIKENNVEVLDTFEGYIY